MGLSLCIARGLPLARGTYCICLLDELQRHMPQTVTPISCKLPLRQWALRLAISFVPGPSFPFYWLPSFLSLHWPVGAEA